MGDIESIQLKNEIEECNAIIAEHEKYEVENLKDYTLRTDYVMSSLSLALKYCDEQIRETLIDHEFWEVDEELSLKIELSS